MSFQIRLKPISGDCGFVAFQLFEQLLRRNGHTFVSRLGSDLRPEFSFYSEAEMKSALVFVRLTRGEEKMDILTRFYEALEARLAKTGLDTVVGESRLTMKDRMLCSQAVRAVNAGLVTASGVGSDTMMGTRAAAVMRFTSMGEEKQKIAETVIDEVFASFLTDLAAVFAAGLADEEDKLDA